VAKAAKRTLGTVPAWQDSTHEGEDDQPALEEDNNDEDDDESH
jgi:hypothetical protein